jgi:hypothetical protein
LAEAAGEKGKAARTEKKTENTDKKAKRRGKSTKPPPLDKDTLPMITLWYRTGEGFFSVKLLIFIFFSPGEKRGGKV